MKNKSRSYSDMHYDATALKHEYKNEMRDASNATPDV